MKLSKAKIKDLLDAKAEQYERPDFIAEDPILIPRSFQRKEDQEIAGFFAALFAWGQRKTIINKCKELLERMDNAPADFIRQHEYSDLDVFDGFVHRTFNAADCLLFAQGLKNIYLEHGGLETLVTQCYQDHRTSAEALHAFRAAFIAENTPARTKRHLGDSLKGSSAKRMNMYLRWMVRSPEKGVDLGLWKGIEPSKLSIPLDVHTAGTARRLGLLRRKQNDQEAVKELDRALRSYCPEDPVKYDFALFGLGIYEDFSKLDERSR